MSGVGCLHELTSGTPRGIGAGGGTATNKESRSGCGVVGETGYTAAELDGVFRGRGWCGRSEVHVGWVVTEVEV